MRRPRHDVRGHARRGPGDVLALSAGGETASTSNGVATVAFLSGVCTAFDVRVAGASVAGSAAYAVTVRSGLLAVEAPPDVA
ncbi:MAG TPA: hypothetical protein VHH36_09905 [Candidatus Thermoplasmatota archaeon]|nr:hypothetical protein [Candidatus Thermoplasmatota archaeon]